MTSFFGEKDFEQVLKLFLRPEKEGEIIHHILKAGEKVGAHSHDFNELVRISDGSFLVTMNGQKTRYELHNQPINICFPFNTIHDLEAISDISYIVAKDGVGKTIFED